MLTQFAHIDGYRTLGTPPICLATPRLTRSHIIPAAGCAAQGGGLDGPALLAGYVDVGVAGECPVHLGHRQRLCPCDGELGLQGLDGQRRAPPPGEHYGPGGDAFLVGLVVGEGDGLVISSSTL